MKEKYAVVTGASRGLGLAFAEELSRRGIHTVLISSSGSIAQVCQRLKNLYYTDSQYIVADLTKEEEVIAAANEINKRYNIYILINNAGLGGSRCFEETEVSYVQKILHLNVMATSLLCRLLMDNLLRQGGSHILNVASLAALTPTGYKMVYPASKAFVRHFSRGLRAEFRERNLTVSVVSPGAMATSAEIRERIEKQGFWGRLTLVGPEKVARKSVTGMLRGRKEIILNPLGYLGSFLIPEGLRTRALTRIVKRETEERAE